MLIDIDQAMINFRDEPIRIGGADSAPATLKDVLEFVLVNVRGEQTADEKYRLYTLLGRIHAGRGKIQLTVDEVATIKTLAGPMLTVPVMGALFDALEGVSVPRLVETDREG
jgi:hypothetical protein